MTDHQRRIDSILGPDYLADLGSRGESDLREMRQDCIKLETEYSYLRRLAHARIAILEAERERRQRGRPLDELIDSLPRILAGTEAARPDPVRARIPVLLAPGKLSGYRRGLERLVEDDTLANLPSLSDGVVEESIEQLRMLEREVSDVRGTLQRIIDTVGRELGARAAGAR